MHKLNEKNFFTSYIIFFPFSTSSDDNPLQFDSIVCAMGVRYKSYCSNIVRTLLVNPEEPLQKIYEFLVTVEEEIMAKLQHGNVLSFLKICIFSCKPIFCNFWN